MATRPRVAAVARLEPLMAAKQAQAATVAMASPPRRLPNSLCTARYKSSLMPAAKAKEPMRMNSGITLMPWLAKVV